MTLTIDTTAARTAAEQQYRQSIAEIENHERAVAQAAASTELAQKKAAIAEQERLRLAGIWNAFADGALATAQQAANAGLESEQTLLAKLRAIDEEQRILDQRRAQAHGEQVLINNRRAELMRILIHAFANTDWQDFWQKRDPGQPVQVALATILQQATSLFKTEPYIGTDVMPAKTLADLARLHIEAYRARQDFQYRVNPPTKGRR